MKPEPLNLNYEDGWCIICSEGTESGELICEKHTPEEVSALDIKEIVYAW